jgi:hypothetical protein
MFNIVSFYLIWTLIALLAGLLVSPAWFYVAIALCVVQVVHFGIEDKNFFSFSCQVRLAMIGILLMIVLVEPMRWFGWVMVVGLTARLTVNYCLLARLVSLLPWNSKKPFSLSLVKEVIFSPPVKGSCLKK